MDTSWQHLSSTSGLWQFEVFFLFLEFGHSLAIYRVLLHPSMHHWERWYKMQGNVTKTHFALSPSNRCHKGCALLSNWKPKFALWIDVSWLPYPSDKCQRTQYRKSAKYVECLITATYLVFSLSDDILTETFPKRVDIGWDSWTSISTTSDCKIQAASFCTWRVVAKLRQNGINILILVESLAKLWKLLQNV